MSDPLNDALHQAAFTALDQFIDAAKLSAAPKLTENMKIALEKGWIEKRGANYYVVDGYREELDAAYPGDTIYAS